MSRAPRTTRKLVCSGMLLGVFGVGCSRQDRVVGSDRIGDAGAPRDARGGGSDAARPKPLLISTDFASDEGLWDRQRLVPGSSITFGANDVLARDGLELVIRLPGMPGLGANDYVGPDLATQISTRQFLQYGTLRTRLAFPSCQPGEDAVSAAFAFFNDGSDMNANGLADNPELDFQVLCGRPSFIVLTAWRDFELGSDGAAHFLKMSHAVDTSTGDTYELVSTSADDYAKTGNDASLVEKGFPGPNAFYELGFEWRSASVRFFIVFGGKERTLWSLMDADYVPRVPLQVMYNVWHPATHWVPDRTPATYPAADAVLRVDFLEYAAP